VSRAFLGRTVAALAASGATSVTAIAATRPAATVAPERPELIDAGHRLDALQAEWQTAQACVSKPVRSPKALSLPFQTKSFAAGARRLLRADWLKVSRKVRSQTDLACRREKVFGGLPACLAALRNAGI
jgi:hypothetical protein